MSTNPYPSPNQPPHQSNPLNPPNYLNQTPSPSIFPTQNPANRKGTTASRIPFNYRHHPIAFSSPAYHLHASELYLTLSEIKQETIGKEKREMRIQAKVEASKEGRNGKWGVRKEMPGKDDVARLMRRLRTEGDEIV